jgi:hypothetical protein
MRLILGLFLAGAVFCQEYYKHNFHLDIGAALPRGELEPLFEESVLLGFGYGYRFHEFFQADVGFDTAFGAAGVRDFIPTEFGSLRIKDYQHFLPFGGRVILPFAGDRVEIYGGGGGVWLRYSERIRQPFSNYGVRFDCDVCGARNGVGYYGLAGVSIALDRGQHFRLGGGARVYRGNTDGDPFGDVPPRETKDRWVNVFGRLEFRF